jgi:ATP-dependent RNA circularization protein (DNA/RNA ligase family)
MNKVCVCWGYKKGFFITSPYVSRKKARLSQAGFFIFKLSIKKNQMNLN